MSVSMSQWHKDECTRDLQGSQPSHNGIDIDPCTPVGGSKRGSDAQSSAALDSISLPTAQLKASVSSPSQEPKRGTE
ncbi:uncharacterized protein BDZ83DRAFT_395369 [Colletotrichum acutatum]|uniref:Uncharacterized protein n=1 Tax=Glomerella acutata TaxID=27357 RepID=A0AAD8UHF0_GLOAC|nr:uncharacterized protein BDZ83DRAFT_395369 [Colletotrichum acutatum]KAK1723228.1 hypothetical protein BDZ83DRAFT_395369 [Colletotrichum acutatum]